MIVNEAVIRRSRRGPLLALQRLLQAGQVHVVRAAELLDLTEEPGTDSIAGEVWHALRDHVTLIDLYDEDHLPEELCVRIDQARERIWLWSPWVGQRSTQLLPHLQDAADRGVRVNVVVLWPRDVNAQLRSRHVELPTQIPNVVFLHKEHQKVVVIDRRLTFIGSMNVLAHRPGGRHEIMALFESPMLAERILAHERADEMARPPTCPACGTTVRMVTARGGRLQWRCEALDSNSTAQGCGWLRPFSDRANARNQVVRHVG